jgi:hypothetical protein
MESTREIMRVYQQWRITMFSIMKFAGKSVRFCTIAVVEDMKHGVSEFKRGYNEGTCDYDEQRAAAIQKALDHADDGETRTLAEAGAKAMSFLKS